jgi:hypothetical protein
VLGSVEGKARSGDVVFKAGTGAAVFGVDDGVGELEGYSLEGGLLGDAEGKSESAVIVSGGGDVSCVSPSATVAV